MSGAVARPFCSSWASVIRPICGTEAARSLPGVIVRLRSTIVEWAKVMCLPVRTPLRKWLPMPPAVLDAAGVESAHLFGVSMGGMIAQEFVLQYPKRVRSLILGCTAPGGSHAVQAEPAVIQILMRRDMTPDEAQAAILPFLYDPATPRERIDEDMAIRLKWYPPQGYSGQLQAILSWEGYSRISQISARTLVIHGETDRLIPPANANLIAERIRGAKLVLIPHASHIFETDQPGAAHQAILEFLAAQSEGSQT